MEERSYDLCTERFEIWNRRTATPVRTRRVMLVHSESNVGDSFALMLAMRGFESVQVGDVEGALRFANHWRPQVLFVDTLIGQKHDHGLARGLRDELTRERIDGDGDGAGDDKVHLMIALAADAASDPRETLHGAGYDGFCRTPCPLWWMFDVLKCFYAR